MYKLVSDDKAQVYLFPQGAIVHMFRAMAGNRPCISRSGLGTFVDPRQDGGKANSITHDDLVSVIEIDGEEYLHFKPVPIDVALIRGTTADENGNITNERELTDLETLALAEAARNNGGIVIAQVQFLAKAGSLSPRSVAVPGVMVDYVVVAKPENHPQTMGHTPDNPAFSNEMRVPPAHVEPLPLDLRKVIARRSAMELVPDAVVNLGVGMSDTVGPVAGEEGVSDMMTLTVEAGVFGGVPQSGLDFGASLNCEAIIDHPAMFDFYQGGGLDLAIVSFGQIDRCGNVNVSRLGPRINGMGGFIDITQNSKKVVFMGFFMNDAKETIENGRLVIHEEGKVQKLVEAVDQITFSGSLASAAGKPIVYVTERAVFELEDGELTVIEIAPGIDLQRDVLDQMGFLPRVSPDLREMPEAILRETWGELREIILNREAAGSDAKTPVTA
jgi:propionate CoA-transferase